MLRIDDIPQQVADDIQGLRLDLFRKCEGANFISHCDEGAIFHNFRKKIISHSPKVNISLERIMELCYNRDERAEPCYTMKGLMAYECLPLAGKRME